MKKTLSLTAALITLSACGTAPYSSSQYYLNSKGMSEQTPYAFEHCHGYGCKFVSNVSFTEQDWRDIASVFRPAPKTPEAERAAIKPAIALFEQKAGTYTGTHEDKWGTFRTTGAYQHDCVDESTNTTVYLMLLEQKGLLKHHKIEPPTARVPLLHAGRWPHQTALISEIETSKFFAVDSWFHDNGAPPEIVPLREWKEGWKPERSDDRV